MAERNKSSVLFITLLAGTTLGVMGGPVASVALGQPGADQPTTAQTPEQLLRDFVHFTFIDRPDLAAGVAAELIGRNIEAAAFVDLVEETSEDLERFQQAVLRLQRMDGGREAAESLWALYNQGKLDRSRHAGQISQAIQMLLGDARSRLLARERLVAAGEYAMTQLFEQMTARNNDRMQAEVQRLIIDMGQQAVMPLCAAIRGSDPVVQERIANMLGLIGYRTALPYLYDTAAATQVDAVRQACYQAIERLGRDRNADVGTEYLVLAERYYDEQREVTAFPGEGTQLLWAFTPETGLRSTAIDTTVFHEAVAMNLAVRALELDGADASATAMWVASNLSREIDGPANYANPVYPATRRGADFYAISSGTDISMRVLARAIDDRDTPLALRAVSAMTQTAGAQALAGRVEAGQLIGGTDRRPLLESLSYPNRRVQYETALALGIAQPREAFSGYERVVPTLAAAVRDPGSRYALIVASDAERYNSIRRILEQEGLGYEVLPSVMRIEDAQNDINAVPGVDLVVTSLTTETTRTQVDAIRRDNRLAATPVVALVSGEGYTNLRRVYERDTATAVRPLGAGEGEIAATVQDLVVKAAGGPVSREEAQRFRDRALSVLRDLAVSGNPVLRVADASESLVTGLEASDPITRLRIAEVLSYVPTDRVQIALMDMAMNANLSEEERVQMMGRVAASAKRYGSRLEDRQINRLVTLARSTTASEREATAAAALLGALNLQSQSVVPLILENTPATTTGR